MRLKVGDGDCQRVMQSLQGVSVVRLPPDEKFWISEHLNWYMGQCIDATISIVLYAEYDSTRWLNDGA